MGESHRSINPGLNSRDADSGGCPGEIAVKAQELEFQVCSLKEVNLHPCTTAVNNVETRETHLTKSQQVTVAVSKQSVFSIFFNKA